MTFASLFKNLFNLILLSVTLIRDKKLLQRIALVIKDLRDEHGVSQEEMYNDTNVHVGRIETSSTNLTVSTLSVMLKYFNIKMSEFFQRVESKR